jgi:class 3 adenylate cyclase
VTEAAKPHAAVDPDQRRAIDQLLDDAVLAMNRGDRATADALAGQVLEADRGNTEAGDLLAAPVGGGEIRRMTIMFADMVDSTVLSTRVDPEIYRTVVGRYRDLVREIVERYDGHIPSTKGDGLLAVFGYPNAHEDDVTRAVHAGLDITSEVSKLSGHVRRRFGFDIDVRVGIHRGVTYMDTKQDDVYGVGANLTARMCGLADPGSVAVSESVQRLIENAFELEARAPQRVKGIAEQVPHYRVVAERDTNTSRLGTLVGRQSEVAYLQEGWDRASGGTLDVPGVAFQGDAGIGKSRLAWAAVDVAERSHALVMNLNGSPLHTRVGLHPIRRLIERESGISRGTDNAERLQQLRRELDRRSLDQSTMAPLLAPVLGIPPESGYEGVHAEGRRLYEQIAAAVHGYLLACLSEGPALLVIEDMHWFDEDSVDVVNALLAEELGSVLVVMTGRERASLPDTPRTKVFELKPLTDGEADQLILALNPDMNAESRRAVRSRCDGVPLYIEEVVEKLEQQSKDAWHPLEVPDTLYEALFARVRSSSEAVLLLQAAAVIGRTFDRTTLQSVVDPSIRDIVDDVVNQLVTGRVLEPVEQDRWRFRHELLREVAAELSPPSQRRLLHSRVADALVAAAADGNPGWSTVAGHYEQAERHADAARCYEQASTDARQRGALIEARAYLAQAISQIELAPEGPARDRLEVSLRLSRGFLVSAAEGVSSPGAAADFERCLHLSGSNLHEDAALATIIALYGYYVLRADLRRVEQLLGYLDELRSHMSPERQARFVPFSHAAHGMLAWYRGEFGSATEKLHAATSSRTQESADELDAVWYSPNEATAAIYTHVALAKYIAGDLPGAESELAKTEQRCEALDFPQGAFSRAYARQMEVLIRAEAGELERAKEVAVALGAEAEERGFDSWSMISAAQQATVEAMAFLAGGDVDPAAATSHLATVKVFVDIWRALEVKCLITFYDAVLARLLIAAGEPDKARKRTNIALDLASETGMSFYDAELLRIRASTHGEDSQRREDFRAAIDLARAQGAVIFELRSAAQYFEEFGEREPLAEVVGRFPEGSTWPELARASALLDTPD